MGHVGPAGRSTVRDSRLNIAFLEHLRARALLACCTRDDLFSRIWCVSRARQQLVVSEFAACAQFIQKCAHARRIWGVRRFPSLALSRDCLAQRRIIDFIARDRCQLSIAPRSPIGAPSFERTFHCLLELRIARNSFWTLFEGGWRRSRTASSLLNRRDSRFWRNLRGDLIARIVQSLVGLIAKLRMRGRKSVGHGIGVCRHIGAF